MSNSHDWNIDSVINCICGIYDIGTLDERTRYRVSVDGATFSSIVMNKKNSNNKMIRLDRAVNLSALTLAHIAILYCCSLWCIVYWHFTLYNVKRCLLQCYSKCHVCKWKISIAKLMKTMNGTKQNETHETQEKDVCISKQAYGIWLVIIKTKAKCVWSEHWHTHSAHFQRQISYSKLLVWYFDHISQFVRKSMYGQCFVSVCITKV